MSCVCMCAGMCVCVCVCTRVYVLNIEDFSIYQGLFCEFFQFIRMFRIKDFRHFNFSNFYI